MPGHFERLFDDVAEIDRTELHPVFATNEGLQALDRLAPLKGNLFDLRQIPFDIVDVVFAQRQLGPTDDGTQDVVEIMYDTAGHLARTPYEDS